MAAVEAVLALLTEALHKPPARNEAIKQFQTTVWEWRTPPIGIGQQACDILWDLAYDLDFFEPDPIRRIEDTSYYGHERLEQEIRTALRRLADLGIEIPRESPRAPHSP
jgi:hypothetical protein